jgi:hypothetical protein
MKPSLFMANLNDAQLFYGIMVDNNTGYDIKWHMTP